MSLRNFEYSEAIVIDIETYTKKVIDQLGPLPSHYKNIIDGIPVDRHLHEVCIELRKKHPRIKFGLLSSRTGPYVSGDEIRNPATELQVYFPGHVYAVCVIGYGDYSISGYDGGNKYMVYARTINNGKIRDWRRQHFMSCVGTLKGILTNINKYMRPFSPQEIAQAPLHTFKSHTASAQSAYIVKVDSAWTQIVLNAKPQLRTLLISLVETNSELLTPSMRGMVTDFMDKLKESNEHASRPVHAIYARMYEEDGAQWVEMSRFNDVNNNPTESSLKNMQLERVRADDLPSDIAGKLAILTMVGPDVFVEGVGYRSKIGEHIYVIEV